jgi:acyl-CoA synthetase (AMP-forming)/AMP-acid ligase II
VRAVSLRFTRRAAWNKSDEMMTNPLLQRWEQIRRERADFPAILNAAGGALRTFQQIENEAQEWAGKLEEIPVGRVVALQTGNSASWPALLLAAFRSRLVPLPLGRHMEEAEVQQVLELSGAALLLRLLPGAREIEEVPLAIEERLVDSEFLKLTSGTTSAPRLVRFTAAQLVADCDQICATKGISAQDLNFGVIPFSHSYGFSNLLTPLLCCGVPLVASEDRMPRAILEGLAQTGATVFPGTPTFFDAFSDLQNAPALPKMRLCISAGANLPAIVAERFYARFGRKVHTFYGSSECGGIAYDAGDKIVAEPGFVGQPMRGVRITRLDFAQIEVRSEAVGLGYFPEANVSVLAAGRFVPSDLVRLNEDGLFLSGRASEIINVAGRKLNPLEVEAELMKCPGVRQAVVFGVSSGMRGEAPVVCVVGNVTPQEVLQFAQKRLSEWQRPRDYWIVGEIPTNERGKISRRELAECYLAGRKN